MGSHGSLKATRVATFDLSPLRDRARSAAVAKDGRTFAIGTARGAVLVFELRELAGVPEVPFVWRIVLVVALMLVGAAVDVRRHGRAATRPREYGLVQVAIEREGREPDPSTLARLMADARNSGVKVIFTQPQQSGAAARLVAEEIGARTESLDPMAKDWAANLRAVGAKIAGGVVQ